ncbi:NAD(P)H-dependent oxidoreductase subunit E [Candidatus Poribacteria bacterium]|nr:NAD(P)H-dependent oxidoreductase subunit E [Candidatus Poribacteria bacterium]
MELYKIDMTVDKYGKNPWALISILQDIQSEIGYLPSLVLKEVAEKMEIPLTQIYGVATFYKSLSLIPQGKHTVTFCMGTACHVRGSDKILSEVSDFLGVEPGQTTEDGELSLKVANCLGACAIGPVMVVDGVYYAKMSASRAKKILARFGG